MYNTRFIIFFLILSLTSYSKEDSFSKQAWVKNMNIFNKIKNHPFNQELMQGTLQKKVFNFYKSQDTYYLKNFSKALIKLASKLNNTKDIRLILKHASNTFDENLSKEVVNLTNISQSNFMYSHYLLSLSVWGTKEELVAAILPCYWIYLKLAQFIKNKVKDIHNHPFLSWINLYSSSSYFKDVQDFIQLTNRIYQSASKKEKLKMFKAFKVSFHLELKFWEDSYYQNLLLRD